MKYDILTFAAASSVLAVLAFAGTGFAPHPYRLPEEIRLKGVTFAGSSATVLTGVPGAFDNVKIVHE